MGRSQVLFVFVIAVAVVLAASVAMAGPRPPSMNINDFCGVAGNEPAEVCCSPSTLQLAACPRSCAAHALPLLLPVGPRSTPLTFALTGPVLAGVQRAGGAGMHPRAGAGKDSAGL